MRHGDEVEVDVGCEIVGEMGLRNTDNITEVLKCHYARMLLILIQLLSKEDTEVASKEVVLSFGLLAVTASSQADRQFPSASRGVGKDLEAVQCPQK